MPGASPSARTAASRWAKSRPRSLPSPSAASALWGCWSASGASRPGKPSARQERIRLDQLPARHLADALPQEIGVTRAEHDHHPIARLHLLREGRADEEVTPVPGGEQVHARLLLAAAEARKRAIKPVIPGDP